MQSQEITVIIQKMQNIKKQQMEQERERNMKREGKRIWLIRPPSLRSDI